MGICAAPGMGSGASTQLKEAFATASEDDLKAAVNALPEADRQKIKAALAAAEGGSLKIKDAKTYCHFDAAFGAPKPDWMAGLNELAEKFATNLEKLPETDPIISLFADAGSWEDPVGGADPPFVGKDAIKELLGKIPKVLSSKLIEVYFCGSPKIFCCKTQVKMQGQTGADAIIMNLVEVDDDMKIKVAKSYCHFDTAFGAPKPDWMPNLDTLADKFAKNLESLPEADPLVSLFAEGGSWEDPVGGADPPFVGKDAIKTLLGKIPKVLSSKLIEVFYSGSAKIFCCKTEVKMQGQTGADAILMNIIELE